MCFVRVRAMAAGVLGGGVLLALGIQGIASAAPAARAAGPATSSECVPVEAASGAPTQTPTSPASSTSQPAQSSTPAQSGTSAQSPSTGNASPSTTSTSPAPVPELCISVTQPASSIQRGQAGTFTVQVSSQNWTLSDTVTVELQTQPASIVPAFTTQDAAICQPGTSPPAECTMPVPAKQAQALQVQVPVAATATSVTQVSLKALALPATAKLAGPLAASETALVTAAPAKKTTTSPPATSSSTAKRETVPLGPVGAGSFDVGQLPGLNGTGSSVVGVGNASGLFPQITPSSAPSPAPGANGARKGNADPPAKLALLPLGMPVVTAQVIGLIALAVAFLLVLTRMSLRRFPRPRR
jgi:hypothetical protein